MWVVIKYKKNQYNCLLEKFINIFGKDAEFYKPTLRCEKNSTKKKFTDKNLLGDYVFCFHKKLENFQVINILKNLRGLKEIINGHIFYQKEISSFIKMCKSYEDIDGFITQDFFNHLQITKGKFVNGPLTNLIFDVVSRNSKKLKISINNKTIILDKKTGYIYQPI